MDNGLNEKVLDKLTKTCICTGVSRASIKESIKNGATSFNEVREKTGAGSGACCGRRCKEKIEELINSN